MKLVQRIIFKCYVFTILFFTVQTLAIGTFEAVTVSDLLHRIATIANDDQQDYPCFKQALSHLENKQNNISLVVLRQAVLEAVLILENNHEKIFDEQELSRLYDALESAYVELQEAQERAPRPSEYAGIEDNLQNAEQVAGQQQAGIGTGGGSDDCCPLPRDVNVDRNLHVGGNAEIEGDLIVDTIVTRAIILPEDPVNGTDAITLKAPDLLPASYVFTLPDNDGDPSQVLTTDGTGITSWTTPAAGDIINGGQPGPVVIGTTDATDLSFITDSSTRMTIDAAGTTTMPGLFLADGGIDVTATGGADVLNIGIMNADTIILGNSATTITVDGTLAVVNTTNLDVADKLITLNDGGVAGSAFDSGIQLEEGGLNTAYVKTSGDRASWLMKAPATAGEITLTPGVAGFVIDQGSHDPISIGTANGLSLAGQVLSLGLASSGVTGALSGTDWDTFNSKQPGDADLTALAGLATTGLIVRTGAGTAATRTITGTANQVLVASGNGVAGNPTLSLPQDIATTSSPTFANGTFTNSVILEDPGAGANMITLQSPTPLAGSYTLTLPVDEGTANQVLTTDGNNPAALSWTTPAASGTLAKAAVRMSADFVQGTAGAATVVTSTIPFDTVIYDPNSNFNTGTFTYTVPVTGFYLVTINLSMAQVSNSNERAVKILRNGTAVTGGGVIWETGAAVDQVVTLNTVLSLTVGDTLTVTYSNRNAADTIRASFTGGTVPPLVVTGATTWYIHLLSI